MSAKAVLIPVFALAALAFGLLTALALTRIGVLRSGAVKPKDIALNRNWPDPIVQLANSYASQFELPTLFYALVVLALVTEKADRLLVALEWAFVATRFAHAYIHVTSNHVPRRFFVFAAGFALLVLMWAIFAARIVLS
ncbi:MAPEG family protein [Methylosinus sp. Ce-a6]|uniref:MAPEG family protein n=1 Tax=Methylosinus sp. Ce-a6 TaxID=2172005 RepID=UPI00135956F8|nr:MAPEG family protein [Methylosinus sp. Ce-a6]